LDAQTELNFKLSITMMLRPLSLVFSSCLLLGLLTSAASIEKRATCTVTGANNANTDDVPAINSAFASCGSGGIIKFNAGTTYNILSSITVSNCKTCEVQVEGVNLHHGRSSVIDKDLQEHSRVETI
jgi:hypothetical protein